MSLETNFVSMIDLFRLLTQVSFLDFGALLQLLLPVSISQEYYKQAKNHENKWSLIRCFHEGIFKSDNEVYLGPC